MQAERQAAGGRCLTTLNVSRQLEKSYLESVPSSEFGTVLPFPATENLAYAEFLIGSNRPTPVLREDSANGSFNCKWTFRYSLGFVPHKTNSAANALLSRCGTQSVTADCYMRDLSKQFPRSLFFLVSSNLGAFTANISNAFFT